MRNNWIWGVLIVLAIAGVIVFYLTNEKKCKEADTPFECVKKRFKDGSATSQNGWTYKGYTFYSNNRAFQRGTNPEKKGTYNKEAIMWDDGSSTFLSEIK